MNAGKAGSATGSTPRARFPGNVWGENCQYQYQGEPLFKPVRYDAKFYRPPTANQLRHYLNQIREGFQMCF